MPRFYGQPKIHKPGVLIHHTVSYSGFPSYNLKKYIANILVKGENNNAKNSTILFNYIRNVPIEDDKIMVSFDVTSPCRQHSYNRCDKHNQGFMLIMMINLLGKQGFIQAL